MKEKKNKIKKRFEGRITDNRMREKNKIKERFWKEEKIEREDQRKARILLINSKEKKEKKKRRKINK